MVEKKRDLIDIIKEAGVVGAGGAGFPTHIKYSTEVEYVIANGAECEPLLRVDQQLMDKYANEIIQALLAVKERVKAKEAMVGLKSKYKDAIRSLKKASKDRVRLHLLENVYPAGDEHILLYDMTKRIVPEGGIPLQVGAVVSNVATLLWVYEAMNGKPVTDRWLTVTGEVNKPQTIKVPIGTTVRDVLEFCGRVKIKDFKVIVGGPIMGGLAESIDQGILKTTSAIIVLPKDHYAVSYKYFDLNLHIKTSKAACCQCTFCTSICPRNLIGHSIEPHKIMRGISFGVNTAVKDATLAFLCCECQLCYFACPMNLAPGRINALLKQELTKKGIKNPHNLKHNRAHIIREYRLQPLKRLIVKLGLTDYDVDAPISDETFLPKRVKISLKQHFGKSAVCVVKEGAKIKRGDVIGEAAEGISARVHSSIDGIVKSTQGDEVIISSG
ncbi:MAG: 4Fe-4S dicluster domain-containing protein [Candidatus Hydrogenedentota bacterium]